LNIFLDTNILIYAYDKVNQEKHKMAVDLISNLSLKSSDNIVISTQVINEFIVVMTGKVKYPLSVDEVKLILRRFEENFEIRTVKLVDCKNALFILEKYKFSFWDSLIISSAINTNCTVLYTEDLKDKQIIEDKLTVVNPFKLTKV
jgi:predicted nucleic acid-binding protein